MAQNYVLLERIELNASAASVTFANIPQSGYTDLKVVYSGRTANGFNQDWLQFRFNNNSSSYSSKRLGGTGSAVSSDSNTVGTTYGFAGTMVGATATSSTFSNGELYIPNYTSSNNKSWSVDVVNEINATGSETITSLAAGLWSNSAAITQITLSTDSGSMIQQYSTFSLYGLAAVGTTPVIAPKASGGNLIENDGTYWIHTFLTTQAFTPFTNLTCDYLVVAGGGGGGGGIYGAGGGGGAGGLRSTVTGTGGSGSLESAIATTSGTSYTITIGAGGTGGVSQNRGTNGSDSTFSTITSAGGGAGGATNTSYLNGISGGSGGGASATAGSNGTGGSASPSGQGYAGGNGLTDGVNYDAAGGGGGASAVGSNATFAAAGNGGAGRAIAISGSSVTYGGGGAGGNYSGKTNGTGGTGGGGNGGVAGTTNLGGGGGGAINGASSGLAGGSGIVIIRYPIN